MLNGGAADLRRFGAGTGYLLRKLETSRPKLFKAMTEFLSNDVVANDPYSKYFSLPPFGSRRLSVHEHDRHARDIDAEAGYPDDAELNPGWYKHAYGRWGVPARVVDIWPDECWAAKPQIYQSEKPGDSSWDRAVEKVWKSVKMDHYLWRVDRLSGVCQFGVLFLGLDDRGRLDRPPAGIDPDTGLPTNPRKRPEYKLLYVRSFDQTVVRVGSTEKDVRNPRFGQPKHYHVQFYDPAVGGAFGGVGTSGERDSDAKKFRPAAGERARPMVESKVHWTRVVHVADNRMTSEVYGVPRLRVVANLLHDLRKVQGGQAEMFYKGGWPGLAFETWPDVAGVGAEADIDSMRQAIHDYESRTERFLFSVGGSWKSLPPNIASPADSMEWTLKLICCAINVPVPIFMGSMEGNAAAVKRDDAWRARLGERQKDYLEPWVLRPVIDRLMTFGVLPRQEDYKVAWRDLRSLADKDQADIALKKTQAITQYATGGGPLVLPPRAWLTEVMGFTQEQATTFEEMLKANKPPDWAMPRPDGPQGGPGAGRTGRPARGASGRPSGKLPGGNGKGQGRPPGSARGRAAVRNQSTPLRVGR